MIEGALGSRGILCLEDVVMELMGPGPHFREVSHFLWPFKLVSLRKGDALKGVPTRERARLRKEAIERRRRRREFTKEEKHPAEDKDAPPKEGEEAAEMDLAAKDDKETEEEKEEEKEGVEAEAAEAEAEEPSEDAAKPRRRGSARRRVCRLSGRCSRRRSRSSSDCAWASAAAAAIASTTCSAG